jgi:hypothetical protein
MLAALDPSSWEFRAGSSFCRPTLRCNTSQGLRLISFQVAVRLADHPSFVPAGLYKARRFHPKTSKGGPIDKILWNALGWCERTGRIQSAERAVPTHTTSIEGTNLLSASLVRTRGLR